MAFKITCNIALYTGSVDKWLWWEGGSSPIKEKTIIKIYIYSLVWSIMFMFKVNETILNMLATLT